MKPIAVRSFAGVSPRTPARYLADNQAQQAINSQAWIPASLKGMLGTAKVKNTVKAAVQSIYRFGQDIDSDAQYWFEFTTDVDVVRGAIAGDTAERTYYTGDGAPKVTDNVLALTGGTAYPIAAYTLGVPPPASVPTVAVSGTGTGIAETRIYTDTFVTAAGEESQPSGASTAVDVLFGETVNLTQLAAVPAGSHNIATRRIYRSVSGESTVEYLFVAEIPAANTSYADTKTADELGEVCPSLTWAQPPAGLKGLCGGPNGNMAGFVGRDVYLCDPYHPFAYPVEYSLTVPFPVVGLAWMDTTLAILTTGKPSFYQGTHPESMAEVHSDITQACVSKRSIVALDGAVLYASPDGLVKLSTGGSGVVTEQLFTREQWQVLKPSSIKAYAWESKYVAFYDTGTVQAGFVLDPKTGVFVFHDLFASAGYNDLLRDALYLVIGNEIHTWYAGTAKTYTWRSKKFTLPQPAAFTAGQVEAEAYPVTFKYYGDGVLRHTKTVGSRTAFRLPPGKYRDIEFEVSGNVEIFAVAIAQSMQDLADA